MGWKVVEKLKEGGDSSWETPYEYRWEWALAGDRDENRTSMGQCFSILLLLLVIWAVKEATWIKEFVSIFIHKKKFWSELLRPVGQWQSRGGSGEAGGEGEFQTSLCPL